MKLNEMKKIVLAVAFLLISTVTYAQGATIAFTSNNAVSVAQAQTLEYRIYLTPATAPATNAPVLLTNITCNTTVTPNQFACTTPLPVSLSAATITGARIEMTSKEATTVESGKSAPFTMGASAPSLLRITP